MTQRPTTASKGQDMAIDFEKDEQKPEPRKGQRAQSIRTLARTAQTAHHIAMATGAFDDAKSGLGPATAFGAAIEVGESLEAGLATPSVDERMERFPELRGVEVASGAASRFPELAEAPRPASSKETDEEELAR